jgi:hypothetical protein
MADCPCWGNVFPSPGERISLNVMRSFSKKCRCLDTLPPLSLMTTNPAHAKKSHTFPIKKSSGVECDKTSKRQILQGKEEEGEGRREAGRRGS